MFSIIKKCLSGLFRIIIAFYNYCYDASKFYWAVLYPFKTTNYEGLVIKLAHAIEKRISFENISNNHGIKKAYSLLKIMKHLKKNDMLSNRFPFDWAVCSLHNFANTFLEGDEQAYFVNEINAIKEKFEEIKCTGGTFEIHSDEIFKASQSQFDMFSLNRHSIRNYEKSVESEQIEKAVNLAKKCPSSCNLQSIRTYLIQDKNKISEILALQRGNRGFTEKIPQLIIISADLKLYSGIHERNQCYIDGGIFALSLTYALHFYKVGSCLLNWASSKKEDKSLRKILNIPKNEVIIVIMSVGRIPNKSSIPVSARRPTKSIFKII